MFSIGEFAGLGRISVRMLRHYDAIGLLRPARVDAASGYRFYTAAQLSRLNRIIALKDLGFTLQQVQVILDEKVDATELRGMLRLRRAQLEEQLAADATRLARVEARLRLIESEGHMNTEEVVLKPLPAVRIAELTAVAASYAPEDIGPTISPLYRQLMARVEAAGIRLTGPAIAYYDPAPGDSPDAVTTHAAVPVAVEPSADYDFAIVDLPPVESAATLIHRGSMDFADRAMQVIAGWLDENGYRALGPGYAREVYLEIPSEDQNTWVTEFQVPVAKAS